MKLLYLLLCALLINRSTMAQGNQQQSFYPLTKEEVIMTEAQNNKEIVRTLFEECFNKGNFTLLDKLVAPEFSGDADTARGSAGFLSMLKLLRSAFPDIHYTLNFLVAENEQVAVSWNWTGTHKGQFRDYAASGHKITSHGIAIFTVKNSKIVAVELETDRLGFLQGIGVIPKDLGQLQQPVLQK